MKITLEWLHENHASDTLYRWFENQPETDALRVLDALVKEERFEWANWLVTRLLDKSDAMRYAVFAAEQVIGDYEAKYPYDKRPRAAIEAAKRWIAKPSGKNRRTAHAAADAAFAAYAVSTAPAAYAATKAIAAAYAAAYAVDAAVAVLYTARHDAAIWPKLIAYGRELVERKLATEGEAK